MSDANASAGPPLDPFGPLRREAGVVKCPYAGEEIALLLRYEDVRAATKDWATFSSAAPFRVPIPSEENVRSVRQLPIETDPPEHTAWRALVFPRFRRPMEPAYAAAIEALIDAALTEAFSRSSIEVVREFALPLQSRALAHLLGLPSSEAEEWISWGTHVFRGEGGALDEGKGSVLDAYLHRALDRAAGSAGDDFFSDLHAVRIDGRPLTRDEQIGFANLTFAGGRDTVINIVVNTLATLAARNGVLAQLRARPELAITATEELVRFYTPLTAIGRVVTRNLDLHGAQTPAGSRIGLCWASANFDETFFEAPQELRLDRAPNPHVGFGSGPHLCLGAPQARLIVRTLLARTAARAERIDVLAAEANVERHGPVERAVGYERLEAAFIAR